MSAFGPRLRAARKRRGMVLREVAAILEKNESHICKWERGLCTPRAHELERYVHHNLATPQEIFGLDNGDAA